MGLLDQILGQVIGGMAGPPAAGRAPAPAPGGGGPGQAGPGGLGDLLGGKYSPLVMALLALLASRNLNTGAGGYGSVLHDIFGKVLGGGAGGGGFGGPGSGGPAEGGDGMQDGPPRGRGRGGRFGEQDEEGPPPWRGGPGGPGGGYGRDEEYGPGGGERDGPDGYGQGGGYGPGGPGGGYGRGEDDGGEEPRRRGGGAGSPPGGFLNDIGSMLDGPGGGRPARAAGGLDEVVGSGLDGLVDRFRQNGRGDLVDSWVGHGSNRTASPTDIDQALGSGAVDELSRRTGLGRDELLRQLSEALPHVVDGLTPHGRVPSGDEQRGWV